ncbi:ABC-2 family transporter protein [Bacillus sp. THAF10]|nr:ABC-2 family transporter protein [Bacillus sp. THAF10]
MELFKFELYKIFKQRTVWITFILVILFSTGFTFHMTEQWEKDLYKEWEGPITEEKLQLAQDKYASLMEKIESTPDDAPVQFSEKESFEMGLYETVAFVGGIEKKTAAKIEELDGINTSEAALEKEMLEQLDTSYFALNEGPGKVIDFASVFSIVITGAMLLIGLSSIYTQEYSSGVENYMLSAKKGRKQLLWAKLGAASVYTVVVVFAWELFNLAWNTIQYGSEGWGTSLQHYFKYYFSPYDFTMFEFHLVQMAFHLLGAVSFAVLIVLVSSVSKHSLISFFVCGALFGAPFLVVEMMNLPQWIENTFIFSHIFTMNVERLFDFFKAVNLFGVPVLFPFVGVAIMVVVTLVSVAVNMRVMRKKELTV